MPFTTPGVQVDLRDDRATLIAPLHYQGRVDHWTIPSGFQTDFASVPRRLQGLVQALGKWTRPSIAHDWFIDVGIEAGVITARDADGVFRRMMRECGVGFVTRWLIWTSVRWAALFNAKRRPGWHRDLPAVAAISVAVLVTVVAAVWGLDVAVHAVL